MLLENFKIHMRNFQRVKKYSIDIHVAENCNLNCTGCLHFSSIAEEEYIPIEKFQNELEKLVTNLGTHLSNVHLLGGEPLLHPEIKKVLEIARVTCGDSIRISLLTNGILLPQMDQAFWDICRKNKIVVEVSEYPIKVNYDRLRALAKQNAVEFSVFAYRNDFWKWKILEKKLPIWRKWSNFFYCSLANKCLCYRDGRLYTCCIAAYIHHFEKRFCLSGLYDEDANSISIMNDEKKVGRFLARPIPMCRYCSIKRNLSFQPWKHSEGVIDEWK